MNYLIQFFQTPKKEEKKELKESAKKACLSTTSSDSHSSTSKRRNNAENYQENVMKIMDERNEFLNPMMAVNYRQNPIKVRVGRGQYFYDEKFERILDCINNVSHVGHCHPYYVMKMQRQLNTLLTNSRFLYDELMEATYKLLKRFPPELCVVTFVNSGSEANDKALQMAEIHTKKKGAICLEAAYHGITKSCFEVSPYKWNDNIEKSPLVTVAKSPCTYRGFLRDSTQPEEDYANYIESIID